MERVITIVTTQWQKTAIATCWFIAFALLLTRVTPYFYAVNIYDTFDINIFINANKEFLDTGKIYQRFEDYQNNYGPSSGTYKFPPAYLLTIAPHLWLGLGNPAIIIAQRIEFLVLFCIATFFLVISIEKSFLEDNNANRAVYRALAVLLASSSAALHDNIAGVHPEILIFSILCFSIYLIKKRPILAGSLTGIVTALKLYPALILLYFLLKKNHGQIAGFFVGLIVTSVIAIFFFGLAEHLFYTEKILPILLKEKTGVLKLNLSLSVFLTKFGLAADQDGLISALPMKILTIGGLLIAQIRTNSTDDKCNLLLIGMYVSGMLTFLANYWLQYQILLLIPSILLLAHTLRCKSFVLLAVLVLLALIMAVDEGMGISLIKYKLSHISDGDIQAYKNMYPDGNMMWHFTPAGWLVSNLASLKPLLPPLFFLTSWLAINQYEKQGRS